MDFVNKKSDEEFLCEIGCINKIRVGNEEGRKIIK